MTDHYVIIGIHGLANKPPIEEKREWWRQALLEGLSRNCGKTTDELPFDFVYWADLRYADPVLKPQNTQPYWKAEGTGPFPAYRSHKWVEIINVASQIIGAEVDFLETHTGVSNIGAFVLERELTDLAGYYEDKVFQKKVRDRLLQKLKQYKERRIMLISHSMGTIIAYDVLRLLGREDPQFRVDHFVTIGSPLGMPHVKFKIAQEN